MKPISIAFIALSAIILSGCNKSGNTSQVSVAVIPMGTTHVYWKSVQAGAEKAASELGVKMTFIGPQREDDRSQQIDLVNNQSMQNDAIVLAPLDSNALRQPVKDVTAKGKPVVIIDSNLADSASFITSFVATDNREGGRLAARRMVELLGGKGKLAVMRYMQGSASTQAREEGFFEEIARNPGIEIVSKEQYAGATASQAQDVATNLLTRLAPNGTPAIDGIYTSNQTSTYGMLQALKGKNLAGKIKFVGFDCDRAFVEAIKNGEMHGSILQDPVNMGYLGVKTAVAKLRGEKFEPVIDTGATLIKAENLEDPVVATLIKTQIP